MIVGYARTSTTEQVAGLDAQIRDLQAAGAEKVYSEQVSSVASRAKLTECLAFLREGDALMVTKPDRLARSVGGLVELVGDLERRGVGLVLLSMGGDRLDTRIPTSKLMLHILASVAEFERDVMLERQQEGITKAKAEGAYKGRPPVWGSAQAAQALALKGEGKGATEVGRLLGVSRDTVYRMWQAAA